MLNKCIVNSDTIIEFWFKEIEKKSWWEKDISFDRLITDRFSDIHNAAIHCELSLWRKKPLGRLAEIIILDQFSRNIYRDKPFSFAYDSMALALAQEAISIAADKSLQPDQKSFLYMPFMHSESSIIHNQAVKLFNQPGLESNYDFELKHKIIIERFDRYPHRNSILGRESTDEEIIFLKGPHSSF